eukprot:378032_1
MKQKNHQQYQSAQQQGEKQNCTDNNLSNEEAKHSQKLRLHININDNNEVEEIDEEEKTAAIWDDQIRQTLKTNRSLKYNVDKTIELNIELKTKPLNVIQYKSNDANNKIIVTQLSDTQRINVPNIGLSTYLIYRSNLMI